METQDDLDFGENTTESDPTFLKPNEECIGIFRSCSIRDGHVDIVLGVNDTTISVRVDDPETYLIGFVRSLKDGLKIGILRSDESKYFVRRIIENKNPLFPSK